MARDDCDRLTSHLAGANEKIVSAIRSGSRFDVERRYSDGRAFDWLVADGHSAGDRHLRIDECRRSEENECAQRCATYRTAERAGSISEDHGTMDGKRLYGVTPSTR